MHSDAVYGVRRTFEPSVNEYVMSNPLYALNAIKRNRTLVHTVERARTVHRGCLKYPCTISCNSLLSVETSAIMVVLLAWSIQCSGPIICIIYLQDVKYRDGGSKEPWSMFI